MAVQIHPAAFVDPTAQLADGVIVGACAMIEADVVIGEGTRIDSFASVRRFTRMGAHNHVHSYACVGGEPQDLKFAGEESWLEIGDHNTIREFSTQHRGTEGGGGLTRIGSHNLLMAYTHVAHDCQLGDSIVMSNGATLAGHVLVGDHAIIGGLSAVHQFCRVGVHAFVGGMTGVPKDLPPFMLASGARGLINGPNIVGLRRMGAKSELVGIFKNIFRSIWLSGTPRKEALAQIESQHGEIPEVQIFLEFMRSSERGVPLAAREAD